MEQRRLRLGDILDDYCPRERRLTNHAVVAMIEENVKQTRCTTCDAEHAYKGGKLPRRRKKETPAALYKEVLAGHLSPDGAPIAPELAPEVPDVPAVPVAAAPPVASVPEPAPAPVAAVAVGGEGQAGAEEDEQDAPLPVEEGPVHRPLIRAQLPRIEGQKEERRLPEFTIRQRGAGNGHFRGMKAHRPGGQGNANGTNGGNGNRTHGGSRFAGPRSSSSGRSQAGGRGAGGGFRSGGGRKRSR